MAGNKNKLKIRIKAGILISMAFLSGSAKFLSVYASEFGGFDVSTGTGAFDADWSDWDNEPAYEAPAKDNNDTEGLFKYIFIKQCNALGKIMPVMFEKIED